MGDCPHIVQDDEGTAFCDLAESAVRQTDKMVRILFADNLRLREALRTVATNMRALEDGGCDFPRVVGSYSVAVAALSAPSQEQEIGSSSEQVQP